MPKRFSCLLSWLNRITRCGYSATLMGTIGFWAFPSSATNLAPPIEDPRDGYFLPSHRTDHRMADFMREPAPLKWGDPAPALLLRDSLNRRIRFKHFQDQNILILIFSHYTCPAHHLYLPKILALEPTWLKLQGRALWIYPHPLNTSSIPYNGATVLQDLQGEAFASYGIQKIPHVVVLKKSFSADQRKSNKKWKICYSGAVDGDPENSKGGGRADLAEALHDLEYSDYVRIPQTSLHGCPYPYTP